MSATFVVRPAISQPSERAVIGLAVGCAVAVGGLSGLIGPAVVLGLAAATLFVAVAARPALAAYLYVTAVPYTAGIERGVLLPLVRPHEALEVFLLLALAAGWLVRFARGEKTRIRLTRLDTAIVGMAALSSIWPLGWAVARWQAVTADDVMASMALWKYFALYVMYRVALRRPEQVRRCLWLVLLGAAGLAAMALVQSLGLVGIEGLLARHYEVPDMPGSGRGTATLGNAIAVGDYLAYGIALLMAWSAYRQIDRRVLVPLGLVLVGGLVGTGQFSAWIAGGIVVMALLWHERRLKRLVGRALPLVIIGVVGGFPVIVRRLAGFAAGGLPVSWVVRWDNIHTFYLPQLAGLGFVFGVRPDTVLPAPETWRDVIFLESGHLALLWVGGIPLLLAFFWFLGVAMRQSRRTAGARRDEIGAAALAVWASLCVLAILTLFDIHLTLRGGADLLFILLGISANQLVPPPAQADEAVA